MDEMNNKQMVLLTMLVSFVVSTATGIITVAMLEEAPPTLTQTVNRVVERTIERVVTGTSTAATPSPAPVTTVTKEITVFAKEDDLVVAAVEKNQSRIARIFGPTSATSSLPDAIGAVISRDGMIVADATQLSLFATDKTILTIEIGEKTYQGKMLPPSGEKSDRVSLIRAELPEGEVLGAISFIGNTYPKIAQTVILLGGTEGDGVTRATVTKLEMSKPIGTTTPAQLLSIDVTPRIPEGYAGALAVNLDGQLVGLVVGNSAGKLSIYPAGSILAMISPVKESGSDHTSLLGSKDTASVGSSATR